MFVSGCAANGPPSDTACVAFRAIILEPADVDAISDSLAEQILIHNETGERKGCW